MLRREDMSKEEWDRIQAAKARAELASEQLSVLAAIVGGQLAWSCEGELMVRLGCDPEDLKPVLEGLVGLDLVTDWSLRGEAQYTLTKYGAWVMQVKILERLSRRGEELEEDPYWAELAKEPPALKLPTRRREVRCSWLDHMEDKNAIQPLDAVMIDEISGNPVLLLGQTVRIDRRLAKGGAKAQPKRRAG